MAEYPPSQLVQTTDGPVVGRRLIHEGDRQVDAFQGIRYAKAPVGPLRFKRPEPVEPWTEVKEVKGFGPRSIQKEFMGEQCPIPMSEDCLNLNVFTPVWEPENESGFAVIVYVHGGGFIFDSAWKYGDVNICENLVLPPLSPQCSPFKVKKDVVVVTVQYRTGYLGMWSTGDEHCPGNNLLWDLTLALKWVRDNISRFTGDPNNVTLIGQSAGGALVDYLSVSPHSRDLFHKVLPMAGNATDFWSITTAAEETCREAAAKWGVTSSAYSAKFLEELRSLPAEVFAMGLEDSSERDEYGLLKADIAPRIDGDFFPKAIAELRKEAPLKPRMIGVCRDEGLLWMEQGQKKQMLENVAIVRFPEKHFPNNYRELREEYVQRATKHVTDEDSLQRAISDALGDHSFIIGCQQNVMENLEIGHSGVYMYKMDYFNETMGGSVTAKSPFQGSAHCCDISFFLGKGIIWPFEFTEQDKKITQLISTYFTNFAKYGDPNGQGGQVAWLPASMGHPERHLRIDVESEMCDSFFEGRPRWLIEKTKEFYQ